MKHYFAGRYYKHQKGDNTIAVITGKASSGPFLQVITNHEVLQYDSLTGCKVSRRGIMLNYPEIKGCIYYGPFLTLKSPIMGPFHYLPMQCSHEIISMKHSLKGSLTVRGIDYNFTDGTGYIEGDYGLSFPKSYLWLHCNDFTEDLSIMVSIAHIPFLGLHFTGCICAITYKGVEYRLATYKGVNLSLITETKIVLTQGPYRLAIKLSPAKPLPLRSPKKGHMIGIIKESNCTKASFRFSKNEVTIFQVKSRNCSYEYHY